MPRIRHTPAPRAWGRRAPRRPRPSRGTSGPRPCAWAVSTTSPRDPVTVAAHRVGSPRPWGAARLGPPPPPDATCPYEQACDYGDNDRHMDAFDASCLVRGFYRWDGTLQLDKRAGMYRA